MYRQKTQALYYFTSSAAISVSKYGARLRVDSDEKLLAAQ